MPTSRVRQVLLLSREATRAEAVMVGLRSFPVKTAVTVVHSPEEFLALAYPVTEDETAWDLTIVDLQNDSDSGSLLFDMLKARDEARAVPIVCITGPLDGQIAEGYARGANSVVVPQGDLAGLRALAIVVADYWLILNRTSSAGTR